MHILSSNPDHIPYGLLPLTSLWCVCRRMPRDCTERVTRYGLKSGVNKNHAMKRPRESSLEDASRNLEPVCHHILTCAATAPATSCVPHRRRSLQLLLWQRTVSTDGTWYTQPPSSLSLSCAHMLADVGGVSVEVVDAASRDGDQKRRLTTPIGVSLIAGGLCWRMVGRIVRRC